MTQKKQRSIGAEGAERRTPAGKLPAGRESKQPSARRRSEETLAACGKETALDTADRLAAQGDTAGADRMRAWVNVDVGAVIELLRSLPGTRGGNGRELRVGMCGVAFAARRGEEVGFARRACKDRLCPTCSQRRSRRFAASLRQLVAQREAAGGRLLFVTLTQLKEHYEDPRASLDRLLASFRKFRRTKFFRTHVIGGVRSLEVTARKVGDIVGKHVVTVGGIHAHLHCIVEVKDGTCASDIAAAWEQSSEGASSAGVDVQSVDDDNTYQVAKYPVDMSGLLSVLTAAPGYVRRVLMALHGRRLVEAFGAWKEHDLGLREAEGTLVYADRAVYTLTTRDPDGAPPVKWHDGRVEDAEAVLAAFLSGKPEPLT